MARWNAPGCCVVNLAEQNVFIVDIIVSIILEHRRAHHVEFLYNAKYKTAGDLSLNGHFLIIDRDVFLSQESCTVKRVDWVPFYEYLFLIRRQTGNAEITDQLFSKDVTK